MNEHHRANLYVARIIMKIFVFVFHAVGNPSSIGRGRFRNRQHFPYANTCDMMIQIILYMVTDSVQSVRTMGADPANRVDQLHHNLELQRRF